MNMNSKVNTRPAETLEQVEQRLQIEMKQRKKRERRAKTFHPTLLTLALFLTWEVSVNIFDVPTYLLPAPSLILMSIYQYFGLLMREAVVSSIEILLGFGMSVVLGIPLAIAIYQWPGFRTAVYPLFVSAQAVPKVAVAPLFIVWFGFGLLPKVLIAFLIAFFPVVINTVMGLSSIEREKIYLAKSIGLSEFDTFRLIRLPNALPSIFAGLKISITLAVVGAVVGEFVGGDAGLGYQLMIANGSMNTPLLFAGIIALTLLGYAFFLIVELVERWVMPHIDHSLTGGGH
jgi:NitT/TauT family transport system permease protein